MCVFYTLIAKLTVTTKSRFGLNTDSAPIVSHLYSQIIVSAWGGYQLKITAHTHCLSIVVNTSRLYIFNHLIK